MPNAMLARHPAAPDDQVVDEEGERHLVELVGEQLLGEPAREVHQVVGGDRAGDGDLHSGPRGRSQGDGAPVSLPARRRAGRPRTSDAG